MMLAVRVDDIIITRLDADYDSLVWVLRKLLPTNKLGKLTYYTGCVLEGIWDTRKLIISQVVCIDQLMGHFNIFPDHPPPRLLVCRSQGEAGKKKGMQGAVQGSCWGVAMTGKYYLP